MRKIRGSIGAKAAAWVGLVISGIIFVGSIVGACLMYQEGVYTYSKEEARQKLFERVADTYSLQAIADMKKEKSEDSFQKTSFRYGIIEAETLEGLNLNDGNTYVKRNFSGEVTEDELYVFSITLEREEEIDYEEGAFGILNFTFHGYEDADHMRAAIDAICYDEWTGIFYYRTDDGAYYPARSVKLGFYKDNEPYFIECQYDFERGLYKLAGESDETNVAVESVSASQSDADASYSVQEQNVYFSLNGLEEMNGMWDEVVLDSISYAYDNIRHVEQIDAQKLTNERKYFPEDSDTLYIGADREEVKREYCVVSILPEKVNAENGSDLFTKADKLVTIVYNLRYSIYVIMLLSLGGGIFLFVFLIASAGHRKGTEEIVMTWIDKIWFDIYLVIAVYLELVLTVLLMQLGYDAVWTVAAMAIIAFLMGALALMTVLSFAVRVKKGDWWKNTLIYRCIRLIKRGACFLITNMPLFWKSLLLLGVLSFAELWVLFVTTNGIPKRLLLFWFVERVILIAVVLPAVVQMNALQEGSRKIAEGDLQHQIDTGKMFWEFKKHGENLNSINMGMSKAVDERMKSERFKTELITNVSHDIKTPLTSIINYVDLLKKEELHNETAEEYLEVLERQSGRLKKLIEDLMEASKASTGNLSVRLEKLEAGVFMVQTIGEFEEKTSGQELELIIDKPQKPVYIMADGRHFWRVIDNLMNNICKYAQLGTRVYINMEKNNGRVTITFRNTSKYPLNISSEELMERFVRGDSSRNTEGSGLGISIAKSLMELMDGTFELYVDGDLFKVVLGFAEVPEDVKEQTEDAAQY